MYKRATVRAVIATLIVAGVAAAQPTAAQSDWRRIGNTLIDRSLAGLASGPVDRVWYSADGSRLMVRTASGFVFQTSDFETWVPGSGNPPAVAAGPAARLPEQNAQVRAARTGRVYAFAKFVYSSENGGANWDNLTGFRNNSIIGADLRDLAVSPANDEEATVVGSAGVFRTVDGGKSWSGLNQGLPNLPAMRLLSLPSGDQGAHIALRDATVVEWQPGQKQAWVPADSSEYWKELGLRQALGTIRNVKASAVKLSGEMLYLGTADGQLWVSTDSGRNFSSNYAPPEGGPVQGFWVDAKDPRIALAVLGTRVLDAANPSPAVHVLRTVNGGAMWDDISGNLPDTAVRGVTADRTSDAIYVATDRGVFYASVHFETLGAAVSWSALDGLPEAPATDVKLDDGANQLWAAVDGYGIFSTLAPHRFRDPRVVSAADFVARAVAPGSLVSVAGARVTSAQAGKMPAAVLAATDTESQIQIPFEAQGPSISLAVSTTERQLTLPSLPLETAAPAIFVARDGSPMLLDAETGVMLDAMTPAHSRARIQILSTGMGRVTPDWPTGLAGPVDNPPKVAASVHAYLDRQPVEVTNAVLAPYIGYYLIEIVVPKIVNYGPAELYLEIGGQTSNRVRVYIEP